MRTSRARVAGYTIDELEKLSAELDKEMVGVPENTRPLTSAERRWYRKAIAQTEPKVKVTIRLRRWQIERARQLAKQKGLRGYQTLVDQILTKALLP
ncbi:MAG: hypothetical protein FJ290_21125 [Planctomycetes bacterium]|nr:hypothetical protein [Planctomycetota bacterium]